ncbi:MAG: hypothetical protein OES53_09245 [Xanthomonadales bacterium]|nr:hypothetical protein [Xanthomonadales bacterium]MDH3924566.1 hypothetical protein [Xanthomonadales bacterium]MDH3941033.1 hypothetical protein [Xanthomonadales bacterium]MDH4002255.1 hypothetical protein [Xanthomonadales bacterium]
MSLLKNKHVVTAAIVMPVLALISYFGVDMLMGERPHPAREGQSYQLVEKPNCRYNSGHCGLKNGDFELDLVVEQGVAGKATLSLSSAHPLEGVLVAINADTSEDTVPAKMEPNGEDGKAWSIRIAAFDPGSDRLHLAATARDAHYFGEVSLKFAEKDQ